MLNKLPFTEKRPWGEFREFATNETVTVKIIQVQNGERLSLQKHQKRSEFWKILSGSPKVTIGGKITIAKEGDEFTIPVGENHHIEATYSDVKFLEISRGEFDENDIIRIDDKYGRT